ncbi:MULTISPECIES: hypothetical protein [Actinokineospora]|nr:MULTISPECIES: hypothetical protein [Actinokineospora]UVS78712.1 hypothetical protein Actkin_02448 [Actinokineospora sp. UTMC 2448]
MSFTRRLVLLVAVLLTMGTTSATASVEWEVNYALPGTPPDSVSCTSDSFYAGVVCWEAHGDIVWVYSGYTHVTAWWWNYYPSDSVLHRQGKCVSNRSGWAYCNKNMHERSLIALRACDSPDQDDRLCSSIIRPRA